MRSMRQFLTLLLISFLILIVFTAAMHGYRATSKVAASLMDRELESVLNSVVNSQQIIPSAEQSSEIVYQIWQHDELVSKSVNAPDEPIARFQAGFSESNFNGLRWRTHGRYYATPEVWVMVAQPIDVRYKLAESMTISSVMPAIISVPILALIVFWAVSKGLSPLRRLSENLSSRTGKDLSRVRLEHVPNELSPVVNTLNSMFTRLNDAFEREQQFASNAAHELRTPLSVMKINLHNLARDLGPHQAKIHALEQDTNRMIHVVNQILLLSRTSPEMFYFQQSKVDMFEVAQQVISDVYGKIEAKHQQIELLGQSTFLLSTEFTLYTLMQNLIINASAYSPEKADIRVCIKAEDDSVYLNVSDSGPGIPEHEMANVLKRFYRDQKQTKGDNQGSGLGLAIVGQIVQLHHASITLGVAELGGLAVSIQFPKMSHEVELS